MPFKCNQAQQQRICQGRRDHLFRKLLDCLAPDGVRAQRAKPRSIALADNNTQVACDDFGNINLFAIDINSDAPAYATLQYAMATFAVHGVKALRAIPQSAKSGTVVPKWQPYPARVVN